MDYAGSALTEVVSTVVINDCGTCASALGEAVEDGFDGGYYGGGGGAGGGWYYTNGGGSGHRTSITAGGGQVDLDM